jgi:hypothetical protein
MIMARIAKGHMHRILDAVGQAVKDADQGHDGIVSRNDMKTSMKEMDKEIDEVSDMFAERWDGGLTDMIKDQHDIRKVLINTFYRFVDHRDHKPGARITDADIDKAVAYAKEKLVDAYDVNNNGLSAAEIAEMGTIGQMAAAFLKIVPKVAEKSWGMRDQVQQLEDMRDDLTNLVNDHEWSDVLAYFPEDIVKAQRDIGIGEQQFIIEAMGLNVNDIAPAVGDTSDFARLNNIESMWFEDSGAPHDNNGMLSVKGELRLKDGSSVDFSILVEDKGDGTFGFTSAVG